MKITPISIIPIVYAVGYDDFGDLITVGKLSIGSYDDSNEVVESWAIYKGNSIWSRLTERFETGLTLYEKVLNCKFGSLQEAILYIYKRLN